MGTCLNGYATMVLKFLYIIATSVFSTLEFSTHLLNVTGGRVFRIILCHPFCSYHCVCALQGSNWILKFINEEGPPEQMNYHWS